MGLGLALCPLTLPAQSITIAWNPSTNANVAGYKLYYGTDGTNFGSHIDAGSNAFATVTGLTPGSTNYFEVADYYRDRQNTAKMSEAIADAQGIDADDRRLKFYRGILLVMNGKNPTEAESLLKSYLATVPDNSDLPPHSSALEWLGKLYEAQGRFSEAAGEYRASLTLDPHNKAVEEALKRVGKK